MNTLDNMENMFGKVSPQIKKRVLKYIDNPTVDNWDDIASIIINSSFTTVWQAVLEINPSFTRQGRTYDENDNIINDWEEIPSPFEVVRAIKESQ